MTEPGAEKFYQEGQLQAERDNSRQMKVCPMPEGTDEAKWWHRGYDHMVLIQDRARAVRDRRELGFARQRLAAMAEEIRALTRRYELEIEELRGNGQEPHASGASAG